MNPAGLARQKEGGCNMNMKRVVLIVAFLYCIAPDLFVGPLDDALVLLGSMAFAGASPLKNRDPEYMRMDRDF